MSRDVLREATGAPRRLPASAVDHDASELAHRTRAQVMRSLHDARRRRATKLTVLIPLAAILVGSTAWANGNGRLEALFHLVRNPVQRPAPSVLVERRLVQSVPPLPGMIGGSHGTRPEPVAAVAADEEQHQVGDEAGDQAARAAEPRPEPVAEAREPVGPPAPAASPSAEVPPAEPPPPSPHAEPQAPAPPSRADQLYRQAHQAHFVARGPAAALAAWDAYLRHAPAGRFALEAQYNRAICLVRLGRHEAARQALAAFADGAHGGYRQGEARALLEALTDGSR